LRGKDELLQTACDECGQPLKISAILPKRYLPSRSSERNFELVCSELHTTTLSLEWLGIDNHNQTRFVWVYPHAEASEAFANARSGVETLAIACENKSLDEAIDAARTQPISPFELRSLQPKLQLDDPIDSELERIKDSLASMQRLCSFGGYLYFGRGGVLKGAFAASEVILRATDSTTTAVPQEQPLQLVYGECCKIVIDDETCQSLQQLNIRPHKARVAIAPAMITRALLSGFSIVQVTALDLGKHGAFYFAWVPPGHQSFQLPRFKTAVPVESRDHGGFLCVQPNPCRLLSSRYACVAGTGWVVHRMTMRIQLHTCSISVLRCHRQRRKRRQPKRELGS
jgi:hypothetical protein